MYAERSGMAYVVTKGTTMSSRQKVSSKIPRKRWGGVVENKRICGGFCEKLGMGLEVGFRYYVNTSVVVCCHNNEIEYRHKNYFGFGRDIVLAQSCWWGCKLYSRYIWREDSRTVALRRRIMTYTIV